MVQMMAEPAPFVTDTDGVVRIGKTRVTLDTLVAAFRDGASAEEIVEQYPSLHLDEVYLAIGYYLRHQAQVEEYLLDRRIQAHKVRAENETRFSPIGVRARLLARRSTQG
jgi:uncharacterized protein (DUF433 family)